MKQAVMFAVGVAVSASAPAFAQTTAPSGGTIVITAKTADGSPVSHSFMDALTGTLNAKGFTILGDPEHVGYLAEIIVSQDAVGTAMEKDRRESVGMVGSGAYLPLKSGGYTASDLRRTRLEISISRRGGGVVWHGAAVTVRPAGTPKGTNAAVAQDLGTALLSGYPEQPEDVVGVP
jgi:hypothetical protein